MCNPVFAKNNWEIYGAWNLENFKLSNQFCLAREVLIQCSRNFFCWNIVWEGFLSTTRYRTDVVCFMHISSFSFSVIVSEKAYSNKLLVHFPDKSYIAVFFMHRTKRICIHRFIIIAYTNRVSKVIINLRFILYGMNRNPIWNFEGWYVKFRQSNSTIWPDLSEKRSRPIG